MFVAESRVTGSSRRFGAKLDTRCQERSACVAAFLIFYRTRYDRCGRFETCNQGKNHVGDVTACRGCDGSGQRGGSKRPLIDSASLRLQRNHGHRFDFNQLMHQVTRPLPPLLRHDTYDDPSEFTPENLLREARRQKGLSDTRIPEICLLDPDGDMVRQMRRSGDAHRNLSWACYHTDLYDFERDGRTFGIVGCAVGAAFAVLVAEQLFASGCKLLISMTSSGQILPRGNPPYFVLIEKALRDEGTSYHYLPPSDFAHIRSDHREKLEGIFAGSEVPVYFGPSWTTDAPFRETAPAIEAARGLGILAVEMEAAALYAFAEARRKPVVCFAHVTNQMARAEGDFEKGEADGSHVALHLLSLAADALLPR